MEQQVSYRTGMVEGISIFYREAGPKGAPTILLLHGLPSSSPMFQPLLTRLARDYHLVAPDYPGFGHSDRRDPKQFAYTFDHIAQLMNGFTQVLIVQDAVAHNKASGRIGSHDEHFGQTGRLMKKPCAKTSCRSQRQRRATSETIRMSSSMIQTCGQTHMHFSTRPGRHRFKAISSTTTAPMSSPIPGGRPGFRKINRGF